MTNGVSGTVTIYVEKEGTLSTIKKGGGARKRRRPNLND